MKLLDTSYRYHLYSSLLYQFSLLFYLNCYAKISVEYIYLFFMETNKICTYNTARPCWVFCLKGMDSWLGPTNLLQYWKQSKFQPLTFFYNISSNLKQILNKEITYFGFCTNYLNPKSKFENQSTSVTMVVLLTAKRFKLEQETCW